jgi:hypothetical protein
VAAGGEHGEAGGGGTGARVRVKVAGGERVGSERRGRGDGQD